MPSYDVKCVFLFRDSSGTGWSEIHYWNTTADNPSLNSRITHMTDVVAPARAALLSADCFLIGCRASYPRPGAVASLSKTLSLQGNLDISGVSPAVSLATKFTDSSATRHKVTHLRGFWDIVEINGEYHPEGGAAYDWTGKFNDWKGTLIGGQYGWRSRDIATSAKGVVSAYSADDDGRVTFIVSADAGLTAQVGKVVSVRFSRLNDSKSPLNKQLLVEVLNATTLKTVSPIAAGPFTGQGRYSFRASSFVQYAQVYDVSLGRRPQGRPFGQLPGRGPKTAKY